MPTSCEIEFENNPLKVIYGGQTLRGTVRLTLTEEKNVRGIYINIHGTAHAQWSIGTGSRRVTHTGNEDYLNEKTFFVGGSSGSDFFLDSFLSLSLILSIERLFSMFTFFCLSIDRRRSNRTRNIQLYFSMRVASEFANFV